MNEIKGNIKIIYQNSCSLQKNFKYILCNAWYQQADILIFSETRIKNINNIHINGFKIAFISESNTPKLPRGIICFIKEHLSFKVINSINETTIISGYQHHVDLFYICVDNVDIISGYKSPNASKQMFSSLLNKIIEKTVNVNKIIIGDFNYDCFNMNSYLDNYLSISNFKRGINPNILLRIIIPK